MKIHRQLIKFLSFLIISVLVLLIYPLINQGIVQGAVNIAYPPPLLSTPQESQNYYFSSYLPLVAVPIPPPPSPHATLSRYITTLDYDTMDLMGCNQGLIGTPDDFVILDFGAPWIDQSSTPYKYGVQLMDYQSYKYISEIELAVKFYLSGYFRCFLPNAHITLVIGTNNSGQSYYVTNGHGQAWAEMVKRIENWIKALPTSYETEMTSVGAIDIEFPWNTYNTTVAWVNGYGSIANNRPYYNYGTCDSCPYRDHPDWTPINFGWSLNNAYYVSFGAPPANVIPEIYAKDIPPYNGSQAYQWQNLKSLYPNMVFTGALTQYDACHDPNNQDGIACVNAHQDNTPQQGWQLFWTALNSDPTTAQPILPYSTDFSWKR